MSNSCHIKFTKYKYVPQNSQGQETEGRKKTDNFVKGKEEQTFLTSRSISKTRAVVTTGKPIHGNTNQTQAHLKEKIRMSKKDEKG